MTDIKSNQEIIDQLKEENSHLKVRNEELLDRLETTNKNLGTLEMQIDKLHRTNNRAAIFADANQKYITKLEKSNGELMFDNDRLKSCIRYMAVGFATIVLALTTSIVL